MMGLLVPTRAPYEPHPAAPILPAFVRRALQALFKRP
jgi:hypothetical protein